MIDLTLHYNIFFLNRTVKLSEELSHFKMGSDSLFLTKLTKQIFAKHLEAYIG